ncbi:MAG: sensor histidine kinase, partial [Anaerolineales bacterium]
ERSRIIERLQDHRERLKMLTHRLLEVQEEERRHIALELHDEIGQDLTGVKMLLAGHQDGADPSVEEAVNVVEHLMEMVRDLSLRLHPPMLEQMGLLPSVLWQSERYTSLTGVRVQFSHHGIKDRRFPPPIENAVYRVMQEALTNIARHAQVNSASVCLWADEKQITLQVEDEGLGFDPESPAGRDKGIGLSGIRERVALLGGSVEVDSVPNQGTRITVVLPILKKFISSQERAG